MFGLKLRCWQKSSDTLPYEHKTTFVGLLDWEFKYLFVSDSFFGFAPGERLFCFFERNFYITFFVVSTEYFASNLVANIDFFYQIAGVDIFSSKNNTCTPWCQIYKNRIFGNGDDSTFNNRFFCWW